MKELWNKRYNTPEAIYGQQPNLAFSRFIRQRTPGHLLLPAEGEGRNALFAAHRGWQTDAFDYSTIARDKAMAQAQQNQLHINYFIADINTFDFTTLPQYDAIALIFFHLYPQERKDFHKVMLSLLKPGGSLLLYAFSKRQIAHQSGGPRNLDLLYQLADIKNDFADLEIITAKEQTTTLNEGPFHQGVAQIIHFEGINSQKL